MRDARERTREIAGRFLKRGDQTGWFEEVYATANFDPAAVPWADSGPNANVMRWLEHRKLDGTGRTAMVVGCGLGDDAEELSRRGFEVTAFDVSATAIDWCGRRFPQSQVRYVTADLLSPTAEWIGAFDFVLEVFTIQTLQGDARAAAMRSIAQFVTSGGELLVICRGRDESDSPGNIPWPLFRAELDIIATCGVSEIEFEDFLDEEIPPVRRFRVLYRR